MRRLRFLCCRDLLELLGGGERDPAPRSGGGPAAALAMLDAATWACHLATILKTIQKA